MDVKNKVVIITGASGGIGKATAQLLSEKGAKVVLVARSTEKLHLLSKELPESFVIPTDMTNNQEIKAMVRKAKDHFGRIDILINNAGQGYDALVEDIESEVFHKIFDLDIMGGLIAMQQVIPIMRNQGKGAIVNISSGTALMILPGMSAYASLKQAFAKISLTAREELKKDNISVTVVYPYITATDFEKNTIKAQKERKPENNRDLAPADLPGFVAQKILEGIVTENAEITAHEWMKQRS